MYVHAYCSLNRGLEFCVPIQAFWHDQRALLHSALTAFCASQEAEPVVAGMRGDARQCETAIADELVQRRFLERPTAAEESVLRQPLFQGTLVGHRVHISEAQLAVGETKMESGGSEVLCALGPICHFFYFSHKICQRLVRCCWLLDVVTAVPTVSDLM